MRGGGLNLTARLPGALPAIPATTAATATLLPDILLLALSTVLLHLSVSLTILARS